MARSYMVISASRNTVRSSWLLKLAIATLLIPLAGCGGSKTGFDSLVSQGGELRVYEVFGMDCPGCHGGLENLVNKVPGVKASKANWEKQRLQVLLVPGATVEDETIFAAIQAANFTPGKRLS